MLQQLQRKLTRVRRKPDSADSVGATLPEEMLISILSHLADHWSPPANDLWIWMLTREVHRKTLLSCALVCRSWNAATTRILYASLRPADARSCILLVRTLRQRVDLRDHIKFLQFPDDNISDRLPYRNQETRTSRLTGVRRRAELIDALTQLTRHENTPNIRGAEFPMNDTSSLLENGFITFNEGLGCGLQYLCVEGVVPAGWPLFNSNAVFRDLITLRVANTNLFGYYRCTTAFTEADLQQLFPVLQELILDSVDTQDAALSIVLDALGDTLRSLTLFDSVLDSGLTQRTPEETIQDLNHGLEIWYSGLNFKPIALKLHQLTVFSGGERPPSPTLSLGDMQVSLSYYPDLRELGIDSYVVGHIVDLPPLLHSVTIYYSPYDTGLKPLLRVIDDVNRRMQQWKSAAPQWQHLRLRLSHCRLESVSTAKLIAFMLHESLRRVHVESSTEIWYVYEAQPRYTNV